MAEKKKETLTVTELAERWEVCRATVVRHLYSGVLPNAFRVGDRIRIPMGDVEAHEKRYRVLGTAKRKSSRTDFPGKRTKRQQ